MKWARASITNHDINNLRNARKHGSDQGLRRRVWPQWCPFLIVDLPLGKWSLHHWSAVWPLCSYRFAVFLVAVFLDSNSSLLLRPIFD